MKIKVEQLKEQAQTKYIVTIEGKEWQDCLTKGLAKITKNIQVPGFRKGQVPMEVVKGKVSEEEIIQESAQYASDLAYKFVLKEKNPQLIMQPELQIEDVTSKKATLAFVVQNLPEIKLSKYSGFNIVEKTFKVTTKEVDIELENILKRSVSFNIKKGMAEKGDVVELNFEGFIDKKAFEGGKGENYQLELGSNSFIPGFEDQLIGLKAKEKKDVEVTFPKEYHAKEMAGKKAKFKCKINVVKKKNIAKLNDEFVKELKLPNIATVDQLTTKIEETLKISKKQAVKKEQEKAIIEKLLKDSKFKVPVKFLELEVNDMIKKFEENLKAKGMTPEKFKEATGQTDEDIVNQSTKEAEKRVRVSLIFEHIGNKEKIDVTQKEIDVELTKMAKASGKDVEEIKKEVPIGRLAYTMRMEKIFDIIKK